MPADRERGTPPGLATGGALKDRLRSTNPDDSDPISVIRPMSEIMADLCERATAKAYHVRGPIPIDALEAAARELRWAAGVARCRRDDVTADAAERAARTSTTPRSWRDSSRGASNAEPDTR
jgi:hypothetical protein